MRRWMKPCAGRVSADETQGDGLAQLTAALSATTGTSGTQILIDAAGNLPGDWTLWFANAVECEQGDAELCPPE